MLASPAASSPMKQHPIFCLFTLKNIFVYYQAHFRCEMISLFLLHVTNLSLPFFPVTDHSPHFIQLLAASIGLSKAVYDSLSYYEDFSIVGKSKYKAVAMTLIYTIIFGLLIKTFYFFYENLLGLL